MHFLLAAEYTCGQQYAKLLNDYKLLGINKLQARMFHDFYGLRHIPIAKDESIEELMECSITQALTSCAVAAKEIGYLIYAHTSLTKAPFGHNTLQRMAAKVGLSQANCFGFNLNKCAAGIEALTIIENLFTADKNLKYILLVTGDKSFTPQQRLLHNVSIAGDAAAAGVFARHTQHKSSLKFISAAKHVHPKYYRGAWLEKSAAQEFEMQFPQLMAAVIKSAINKANITLTDVKFILPHNVNIPVWKKIAEALSISFNKIYIENIASFSHCFTSDFLININAVFSLLDHGDFIIVASPGFGLTLVAAVLQKVEGVSQ